MSLPFQDALLAIAAARARDTHNPKLESWAVITSAIPRRPLGPWAVRRSPSAASQPRSSRFAYRTGRVDRAHGEHCAL